MKNMKLRYVIKYKSPYFSEDKIIMYYFDLNEIETGLMQHRKFLDAKSEILARDLFTGFYDKGWDGIYENDIIKNDTGRICLVVWNKLCGCFDLRALNNKGKARELRGNQNIFQKKIGNKYDNPELLEVFK